MNWFFIALIAPFLWALVNIVDQFLVAKYGKRSPSTGALVLFSSLVGVFVALILFIFVPEVLNVSTRDAFFLILSGVLTIFWVLFYLLALEKEDVSSIVPWFLTVPIFGFVFGYIFFGEILSLKEMIGSLIILFGVSFLSFDFSKKNKIGFKPRIFFYMFMSCLFVALVGVIFKYFTLEEDFWISSFWVYVGLGISGLFIYLFSKNYRDSFLSMLRKGGVKIFVLNITSELFSITGNVLTSYALLLAPVAMVYLVGSFQPAILLILALLGTKFFPKIITENLDKRVLYPKILGILIVVFGSLFLFF